MNTPPTVIVLAAGQGSRFQGDGHKLDQAFRGSTVLGSTLQAVLASRLPVLVVTVAARAALAAAHVASRDVLVLPDDQAARGMGHSIAAGVAARANAAGWLLLPGDLPAVQPASLLAVAAALREHAAAYAQYRGRRGHPVGFGAELGGELQSLSGDDGARRVLARYPAVAVDLDDPGVRDDVDTRADLERLRQGRPSVEPSA